MQQAAQIVFHGIEHSDAVEANVRKHLEHLERHYGRITGCRVVIDAPHHHHQQGNIYNVRVALTLPGHEVAVTHDSRGAPRHHAHEDLYVALRDAFDVVCRRLDETVDRMRGHVKGHEHWPQGHVVVLEPEQDHGFIATPDGRTVYFHRNSVLDGRFDQLRVGSEVSFTEEAGTEGPQASTVRVRRWAGHRADHLRGPVGFTFVSLVRTACISVLIADLPSPPGSLRRSTIR